MVLKLRERWFHGDQRQSVWATGGKGTYLGLAVDEGISKQGGRFSSLVVLVHSMGSLTRHQAGPLLIHA